MSDLAPPRLNPAQQRITDELGSPRAERPCFPDNLGDVLRSRLTETLNPVLDKTDEAVFVSKRSLALLHACEHRYVADQADEFVWSIPVARGVVTHKAIELLVGWRGEPTPLELVERAIDRLEADENGVGGFLAELDAAERAQLTGLANDQVATFCETFPPLRRHWVPVAESRVRAELCDDRLALLGKVDLTLGRADGNVAGKVLIDLKGGRPSPTHGDDLRFYALLETLKLGVPPRLLVTYYLEAGEPRAETVTVDLLEAAARRVIDAVAKLVDITGPAARIPERTGGPGCRWCPARPDCVDGRRALHLLDDPESDAFLALG
ncbi:MAG: PD-(D/E)XK nuclease family protein [Acidimicrobiales bacterium]